MKTNGTTTASSLNTSTCVLTAGAMSTANDSNQSVVITLTDAGNTNYNGCSKDVTITVQKNTRTLSWASGTPAANATLTYGTSYSATVSASGSGGTAGAITYSSNNTAGATINSSSGAITVANGAGKAVTITASMARTATVAATSTTRAFTTGRATGYINISATSGSVAYGTASATLFTVSSHHGGSLSVSDNHGTATVSISGTTVSAASLGAINAGTSITVTATSAQTDNYTAASKTYTLSINRATGYVNLSATSGSVTYGTASKQFTVSSHHGGSLSVTDNNSTAACSISGTTVTCSSLGGLAAGTSITVTVTSAQTTNYNAASKTYTLSITKATATAPTLTGATYTYDGNNHCISASGATSGLTVKYAWCNTSNGTSCSNSWSSWGEYASNACGAGTGKWLMKAYTVGNSNYNDSGASNTVLLTINAASLSGSVLIKGNNSYNSGLLAKVTNTNGASLSYQWYTNTTNSTSGGTAISGATGNTYTVTTSDYGKYIYVVVTATKTYYNTATWTDITDETNNDSGTVLNCCRWGGDWVGVYCYRYPQSGIGQSNCRLNNNYWVNNTCYTNQYSVTCGYATPTD